MSARYNETERLGVLATDMIVTKELHWIFREQPIVDVGIDALIEKSEKGEPAGKFIALQIKSGKCNFRLTDEDITYYVSNVHRNYWLGLNIPMLLVAYIPESDDCYWEIINRKTLRETKTRWKISIRKSNVLSAKSKPSIDKYLGEYSGADTFSQIFQLEFDEHEVLPELLLEESRRCISNINKIIQDMGLHFQSSSQRNATLKELGMVRNDPRMKSNLAQQARATTMYARRLAAETQLFSECFAGEHLNLGKYLYTWMQRTGSVPDLLALSINESPRSVERALLGTDQLRETVSILKNRQPEFKKAHSGLLIALEILCAEYRAAYELAKKLSASISGD